MQNDISVVALCLKLEQKLMEVWSSELTGGFSAHSHFFLQQFFEEE